MLLCVLGCVEGSAPPPPALLQVSPSSTLDSEPTELTIEGDRFLRRGVLGLTTGAHVEGGFALWLGAVPLEPVHWRDPQHLEALLPAGSPVGTWPLRLVDPWGREVVLDDAVTVRRLGGAQLTATGAAPRSVQQGNTALLVLTVTNEGDTAAEAVAVTASSTTGPGGASLLQLPLAAPLEPGARHVFTLPFRTTAPGEVFFSTTLEGLDARFRVPRSTGPVLVGPVTVFSPPVLNVTATAQPVVLAVGEVLEVAAVVSNTGATAVRQFQPAAVLVGDAGFSGLDVPVAQELLPGSTRTFPAHFAATRAGEASFVVEGEGRAADTDLPVFSSPVATMNVRVLRPPSLVASVSVTPAQPTLGDVLQVEVELSNTGEEDATAVGVTAVATGSGDATALSSAARQDVAAGGSARFPLTFLATRIGGLRFQVSAAGTSARGGQAALAPDVLSLEVLINLPSSADAGDCDAGSPDAGAADDGPFDAGPFDAGPLDAGPADAGVEICSNRVDDNGDGLVDCADPRCGAGVACDDGDGCTAGDVCANQACTGPLNACTAQLPACVHPVGCDAGVCLTAPAPMNAPCDGGRCNGAGTCSAFCDPTRSGLRACYRFEGGLLDESAFGNHATSVAPRFDAGVAGRAWLVGDAGADSRDDVSLDCTTALTMESWVYPEAFPTASGRTGVLDNDGQYGPFIGAGGELRCAVGLGLNVPGALTLQTWQHVACIKSGSSLKAYVNGLQVGSTSSPGALSQGTTAGLRLGQNSPSGDVFAGALDGLRIWCEAIPVAELCSTPGGCG